MNFPAFTWPHHIIKIESVQKPIVFEVQQFLAHAHDKNWNPYDEIMYELVGEHRVEAGSGPPEIYGVTLVSLDKDFKKRFEPFSAPFKETLDL